jgi:hypothetical protein
VIICAMGRLRRNLLGEGGIYDLFYDDVSI